MSGHSHWATIKRKKASVDKKKGKIFSRYTKAIIVAARMGGGDPDANSHLRLAVEQARSVNMPKDNIERAIKRGTGEADGISYEEVTYEGVGPGGIAIMVSVLTDNKNRTVSEIRKMFEMHGGNMGTSVAWNFEKKGAIWIPKSDKISEEKLTELAIEGGGEDVSSQGEYFQITSSPEDFENMKKTLEKAGIAWETAEITMIAKNTVPIGEDIAKRAFTLLEKLDDHDDTEKVYSNGVFPEGMQVD